jgi:hypothetical protein
MPKLKSLTTYTSIGAEIFKNGRFLYFSIGRSWHILKMKDAFIENHSRLFEFYESV